MKRSTTVSVYWQSSNSGRNITSYIVPSNSLTSFSSLNYLCAFSFSVFKLLNVIAKQTCIQEVSAFGGTRCLILVVLKVHHLWQYDPIKIFSQLYVWYVNLHQAVKTLLNHEEPMSKSFACLDSDCSHHKSRDFILRLTNLYVVGVR